MLLSIMMLLTITVIIHSLWMFGVVRFTNRKATSATRIVLRNVEIVITALFAHLLESFIFAVFYRSVGALHDLATSFYFSLVSYATIGYGDVTLPPSWRLVGAVEGVAGELMVGWSVAILVAILQRIKVSGQ